MRRLIITGAIGAGKSRLANRILRAYGEQPVGLRSLRSYDAEGRQSFALGVIGDSQSWPLDPGALQTALFERQILPALRQALSAYELQAQGAPFLLIDELGRLEAEAAEYLAFIRRLPASRQILVVRKGHAQRYQLPCELLLDLDQTDEDAALQQALWLFGTLPRLPQTRLILMASGYSRRFQEGADKLMQPFQGKPLVQHALSLCARWQREDRGALALVCAREPAILRLAHQEGLIGLFNAGATEGISASIRLGLGFDAGYESAGRQHLFLPADQPHLKLSTLQALCQMGAHQPDALFSLRDGQGKPGSPVLFGEAYVPELMALSGDQGGRKVFARHPQKQRFLEAEALELKDYDLSFG